MQNLDLGGNLVPHVLHDAVKSRLLDPVSHHYRDTAGHLKTPYLEVHPRVPAGGDLVWVSRFAHLITVDSPATCDYGY